MSLNLLLNIEKINKIEYFFLNNLLEDSFLKSQEQ